MSGSTKGAAESANYPDGLSRRAFAKKAGISESRTRSLIQEGVLRVDAAGHISAKEGAAAYASYKQAYESRRGARKEAGISAAHKAMDAARQVAAIDANAEEFSRIYETWLASVETDPIAVLNSAKAYAQALQTKEAKLKLDILEGNLFSRDRINADAEAVGALVRAKLLTVPARAATVCEGRTARDIEEILDREINAALEDLQKLFIGSKTAT